VISFIPKISSSILEPLILRVDNKMNMIKNNFFTTFAFLLYIIFRKRNSKNKMIVELLRGGTFDVDVNDFKNAEYTDDKEGIILEFHKGYKITIKYNKENINKWILAPMVERYSLKTSKDN
jgi:hypothetical protein